MIRNYFQSYEVFKEDEIKDFIHLFTLKRLDKHDFFIKEGEACNEVAFIKSGIFRSYFTKNDGNDITYCFWFPDELMTAYSAFITGNKSMETMQAITNVEILVIKRERIEELAKNNLSWTRFLKQIAEQQFLQLEQHIFQLQKVGSAERYLSLIKNQSEFVQKIPLKYLASYLGISQRHLSRIRKDIRI